MSNQISRISMTVKKTLQEQTFFFDVLFFSARLFVDGQTNSLKLPVQYQTILPTHLEFIANIFAEHRYTHFTIGWGLTNLIKVQANPSHVNASLIYNNNCRKLGLVGVTGPLIALINRSTIKSEKRNVAPCENTTSSEKLCAIDAGITNKIAYCIFSKYSAGT